MDSLLATYAASSEDDEAPGEVDNPVTPNKRSSLFTSLPLPISSSIVSSFPPARDSTPSSASISSSISSRLPHKSQLFDSESEYDGRTPSSLFSSLRKPKTFSSSNISSFHAPISPSRKPSNKLALDQYPKKIVSVILPMNSSTLKSHFRDDDDDVDDEEEGRKKKMDFLPSSTPKKISSILPAAKNSLCMAPAQTLGVSRRTIMQAAAPSAKAQQESKEEAGNLESYSNYDAEQNMDTGYVPYGNHMNDGGNWAGSNPLDSNYASNPATTECEPVNGNSFGYESYVDNWSDASGRAATSEIPDIGRITGKRGRFDIPKEILEVKQDELMKNRPREDQAKLTGIAFGPSHQPASSAKGKPTKLHKRKHQIGSLYFDMKQKESELAERRSKGFLTKAETQAKYGW